MIARNNPVPIARTPIQSRSGASVCGAAAGTGPSGAAPVGFRRPGEIRARPPRRSGSARVIDGALSLQKEVTDGRPSAPVGLEAVSDLRRVTKLGGLCPVIEQAAISTI